MKMTMKTKMKVEVKVQVKFRVKLELKMSMEMKMEYQLCNNTTMSTCHVNNYCKWDNSEMRLQHLCGKHTIIGTIASDFDVWSNRQREERRRGERRLRGEEKRRVSSAPPQRQQQSPISNLSSSSPAAAVSRWTFAVTQLYQNLLDKSNPYKLWSRFVEEKKQNAGEIVSFHQLGGFSFICFDLGFVLRLCVLHQKDDLKESISRVSGFSLSLEEIVFSLEHW
ncbi:hypothetical protein TEA_016851 [Camellia sinensis var. sinensis]|uniref:Uncharacterized protein n=1 Tax=Camellia sinensis var. sinensis TaxID=542762 RepID=A0A4S4CZI5_CAMSN|nr:hypothetical protein TEA_016851 [Camellia sinensis var. sinensis]